ncbi:hypothetical protein DXC24_15290 [Clostridium sp. OM08-29]|jgi:uncharacterized phage protein (TIGR01671 family)|nr:hypothetical protein DXC24_15290 [Clostridium sp. OM08-29]DAY75271.1 MAG TPA: YopX protein [Caudoviricetes sp.]
MEDRYLFKAKRIDNREWVQGYLYGIWEKRYILWGMTNDMPNMIEVDPSTICQCTDLKDRNGNLIWENDICDRKEPYPEIVKYCNGDWTLDYSYAIHKESGGCYCNLGFYTEERKCVEVIGNIFDNPELLESEG